MRTIPASALVLALLPCAAVRAEDAPTPGALIELARQKIKSGDYEGAQADLERAAALLENESGRLFHDAAAQYAKLGDAKTTVAMLREATKADPDGRPMDLVLWRRAVETSRKKGGSQEPDLQLIQAEVADIRGKPFKADVPAGSQSQDEFGEMVEAAIEKEMPKAKRADMEAGLRRLGFLPESFDFQKEVTDALKSQAAAYYDPKQKKFFNLMHEMAPVMVETIAAHELVHALQDQYFDLEPWFEANGATPKDGVRDDDKTLALRCVVEGEAQYVATIWQIEHMLHQPRDKAGGIVKMALGMTAEMEIEQLSAMIKASAMVEPDSEMGRALAAMDTIQPYVLAPLLAAYMNGAKFVGTIVPDAGQWAEIDKLYAEPPKSAEQCLHPDKYAKKPDLPSPMVLPDVPEIAAASWREVDAAIHGELYLRVLLKRNGVKPGDSKKAAAGWDGDLYRAWRQADGRTAIVLATTWDTEADAKDFYDSYRLALGTKYEKLFVEPSSDEKKDVPQLLYGCGDAALGAGALVLRGREVFAVEGFAKELRAQVVEALLAATIRHVE
jgi:tetratricopeptide (TPR) repeat protein